MTRGKAKSSTTSSKLSAQVNLYTQAALAENTYRSYRADLKHFKAAGGTIPCTVSQLAEYLASHATTLAVATLQHRVIAIHRAHLDAGQLLQQRSVQRIQANASPYARRRPSFEL